MAPAKKKQKSKKVQVVQFHPWAELPPEILGLIFQSFDLEDRLLKLPRICKSWLRALKSPYCWKEIDIHSWSSQRKQVRRPHRIHRMLQTLIERSGDSFEKLCVWALSSEDMFTLIGDNAKNLRTLQLTFSKISGEALKKFVGKIPSLTSLDICQCKNIGSDGLEAIGKGCRNLTSLSYSVGEDVFSAQISDDLAHAIANTMPKLKSLDIRKFKVGNEALMEIITNCKELEELDITGCYLVEFSEKYLESFPNLKIVGPYDPYEDYGNYCDCGCDISSSDAGDRVYTEAEMFEYYSQL